MVQMRVRDDGVSYTIKGRLHLMVDNLMDLIRHCVAIHAKD